MTKTPGKQLIKVAERLENLERIIEGNTTGSPEIFADMMGIERRTYYRVLARFRKKRYEVVFDRTLRRYVKAAKKE